MRQYAFVKFDQTTCSKEHWDQYYKATFGEDIFIYLGEVPNCPGHCILADLTSGKVIGMYHTDNFREATEEEV